MTIFNYHVGHQSAAEIIMALNETNALHCAHIVEVFNVCKNGCGYSNEQGDKMGAALWALSRPLRAPADYEAKWVAKRVKERHNIEAAKKWARAAIAA